MRALKRGDFIGVYRGDWFAPDERHCRSDYSFDADDEFVVVPPPPPIYPTLKAYGTSGPTIGAAAVSKMLAAPKGGREGDPLTN